MIGTTQSVTFLPETDLMLFENPIRWLIPFPPSRRTRIHADRTEALSLAVTWPFAGLALGFYRAGARWKRRAILT